MSGRTILRPLAAIYAAVMSARNRAYDAGVLPSYRSRVPVICVGNLSTGGNFKTPLVIALARMLIERQKAPVVLSRGYGGSRPGPHVVEPSDSPDLVGDEPLLIAEEAKVPVVIARKRVLGAQLIESQSLGDTIILDDGFQHRALDRSVNLIAVNATTELSCREFLEAKILPEGNFRERKSSALRRADAVIITTMDNAPEPEGVREILRQLPSSLPAVRAKVRVGTVQALIGPETLSPQPVIAVSGIANPGRFAASLQSLGFDVILHRQFRDHHPFTAGDIEAIRAQNPNLPIVCTQKDAIKLRRLSLPYLYALEMKAYSPDLEDLLGRLLSEGQA